MTKMFASIELKLATGYMRGNWDGLRPGVLCEHLKDTAAAGRQIYTFGFPEEMRAQVTFPASMKADIAQHGLKLFLCHKCSVAVTAAGMADVPMEFLRAGGKHGA
jgi:hypothetical protein